MVRRTLLWKFRSIHKAIFGDSTWKPTSPLESVTDSEQSSYSSRCLRVPLVFFNWLGYWRSLRSILHPFKLFQNFQTNSLRSPSKRRWLRSSSCDLPFTLFRKVARKFCWFHLHFDNALGWLGSNSICMQTDESHSNHWCILTNWCSLYYNRFDGWIVSC